MEIAFLKSKNTTALHKKITFSSSVLRTGLRTAIMRDNFKHAFYKPNLVSHSLYKFSHLIGFFIWTQLLLRTH